LLKYLFAWYSLRQVVSAPCLELTVKMVALEK
jgi:hypothetical protein